MKLSLNYDTENNVYWITIDGFLNEARIAKSINMSLTDFSKTLSRQYNAYYDKISVSKTYSTSNDEISGLFFDEFEKAMKAYEFIQAAFIAKKLSENSSEFINDL